MTKPARMMSIDKILPPDGLLALKKFVVDYEMGGLDGNKDKYGHVIDYRIQLRDTILKPHEEKLKEEWDLDYLSYAICHALQIGTIV